MSVDTQKTSPLVIHRALVAILCVTATAMSAGAEIKVASTKPNIVLVLADDLGINDLHCYGRAEHHTPNLDRLATQGLRFTCAYAALPICSPSRASLLTGLNPARLNLTNYLPGRPDTPAQKLLQPRIEGRLPLEETTIAEVLKTAGYATGLFGKWHLGTRGFEPSKQGFDEELITQATTTPPTKEAGGKGEFTITAAAETFIEQHRNEPFFCYVPHNCPHIPLSAIQETVARNRGSFNPKYAAMIETLDEAVGRLMKKVDDLGLTDRTIFIFTSDNGGLHVLEAPGTPAAHNHPFRAGKGFLYEGGLREPLIVRWPGEVKPKTECTTPVLLTDLFPTLLEAAGVKVADAVGPVDGVDIGPLLRGHTRPPRTLCWHYPNYTNQGGWPAGAIREGDWKLVETYEDGKIELFNLAADPSETKNLADAEPARAKGLQQKFHTWLARVGGRTLTPNPDFDAAAHKRLYFDQDASTLAAKATAAEMAPDWKDWRAEMNSVRGNRKPRVTPATGDVRLHAKDAHIHGKTLRYEHQPNKNTLGYWTDPNDWAEWSFEAPAAGDYEVEVQQGCGDDSGGAAVTVSVDDQVLKFTVQETGSFQSMILRVIGEVKLAAGRHTLAVKARTKPGPAVMDLRRVVLRPVDGSGGDEE